MAPEEQQLERSPVAVMGQEPLSREQDTEVVETAVSEHLRRLLWQLRERCAG